MTHPDNGLAVERPVFEKRRIAAGGGPGEIGAPVLASSCVRHHPAELTREQLRAVTDPEDRDTRVVERGIEDRRPVGVYRLGASREDDPRGPSREQLRGRRIETNYLRVDTRLSDTPRYELRVLGAEVDDQDSVELIRQWPIPTP